MGKLLSLGLDVGTSTTQLILSQLLVENRAGAFSVPELDITNREIVYKSPVHFTPLQGTSLVDGEGLKALVEQELEKAGVQRQQLDTGAVIITGETSRKENARQILETMSDFAGEFVVATAGPHLESVLAARGSGAVELSREKGLVLHMDMGGGTTNLALLQEGKVLRTGCMNVGGRLVKLTDRGVVTYVSPVLTGLTDLKMGMSATEGQLRKLAGLLTEVLEMAAGLRPTGELLRILSTEEAGAPFLPPPPGTVFSFSGGVAACMEGAFSPLDFGDLGPLLADSIKNSRFQGKFYLGQETIRATVIGAGCHSTQLSGSTVYCHGVKLPVKNLPVAVFSGIPTAKEMAERCAQWDQVPVLAFSELTADYGAVRKLADALVASRVRPLYVAVEQDMAKALGQLLRLRLPEEPVLCLDRLRLSEGDYLDVGKAVGPAYPVVIKTLVLAGEERRYKIHYIPER